MYLKLNNGVVDKYPYSIDELRRNNPNTSFPKNPNLELLAEWGVFPVYKSENPDYDYLTEKLEYSAPEYIEGKWITTCQVLKLDVETASNNIRSQRDEKLRETDWIVIKCSESGSPVPGEWVSYRQALRDLTGQVSFPYGVIWPSKP